MDQRQVDARLKQLARRLRAEAGQMTFGSSLAQQVLRRRRWFETESLTPPPVRRPRWQWLVGGGILGLVLMAAWYGLGAGDRGGQVTMTPLTGQLLDLDGNGEPELVGTWRVRQGGEENWLTVVWSRDIASGNWQLLYSEPVVQPPQTINAPGGKGTLLWLNSRAAEGAYHSRLMGFEGGRPVVYWEEVWRDR